MVLEGFGSWNREQRTDRRTEEEKRGNKSETKGEKEGGWSVEDEEKMGETEDKKEGCKKKKFVQANKLQILQK